MFYSKDESKGSANALRPVITLNSDVEIGEKIGGVWQINS